MYNNLHLFLTLSPMNTLHSGVENEGLNAPSHPTIASISKAALVAIMALMATGCDPKGADVRDATLECLNTKEKAGEQLKALCAENTEKIREIVFQDCEVPAAETEIFFLSKNTTVGAEHGPVNSGIRYFCKGEGKEE